MFAVNAKIIVAEPEVSFFVDEQILWFDVQMGDLLFV